MRLSILHNGHGLKQKFMMMVMRLMAGDPPDVVRTLLYKPAFFGSAFGPVTQHAVQESEEWEIGECELFAAFVSKQNQCPF